MVRRGLDRKSTRLNSSHLVISYAVFCLKKKISISMRFLLMAIRRISAVFYFLNCFVPDAITIFNSWIVIMISVTILIAFFFNDTATTEIYTLSLHDALPIFRPDRRLRKNSGGQNSSNALPKCR